ncbi:MAG: DUF4097 family beta strand repeat-containing protein [Phycisphaerales bacterium]|jgi:hypothetical protein
MPVSRRLVVGSLLNAAWLTASVVGLAGCTAEGVKRAALTPGADVVRIDMTTDYAPGTPLAIDIENQGGDVTISVDPSLSQPMVRATSMAPGKMQEAAPWAAATLSPSGVAAKDAAPILRVLAADISAAKRRTRLEVRVPACAGLRVRNQDGSVSLAGVSGAVDVQNGTALAPGGPISLDTTQVLDTPLLLRTSSGPITANLPAASHLDLEVTTGSGTVSVQATGMRGTDVKATKQAWSATLNGGAAPGKIATDAGDVVVHLVK